MPEIRWRCGDRARAVGSVYSSGRCGRASRMSGFLETARLVHVPKRGETRPASRRGGQGSGSDLYCCAAEKRQGVREKLVCWHACYNGMIRIFALTDRAGGGRAKRFVTCVKAQLVYTHVGPALCKTGEGVVAKLDGAPHRCARRLSTHTFALDLPVSIERDKFPATPEEPEVPVMLRTPCKPGMDQREQHRAGRREG